MRYAVDAEVRDQLVEVFQAAWHHEDEHGDGAGSRTKAGIEALFALGLIAVVENVPEGLDVPESKHSWPTYDIHLYGPWMLERGLPKPTQYRVCVHPDCNEIDRREAPK